MLELVTRTAKLIPYPKRTKAVPGFATAYYYEPEPGPDTELGNLYAVIEVLAPPKQAEEVADLVIRSLGEHYYNSEGDDNKEPAKRFESAIKIVNSELGEYTDKGNGSWVGRMSAVIAIMAGGNLHLTQTGSAEAYLFRKGTSNLISKDLGPTGPHRPRNTFAQFATGELEVDDRLLFTTPALLHHLPKDRLKEIISASSPASAAQEISELSSNHEQADRVAALVIEATTPDRLARQIITDEPEEVQVGTPDTVLGAAKEVAAPVMKRSAKTAQSLAKRGSEYVASSVKPKVHSGALWTVQRMRQLLSAPKGRRYFLAAVAVITLTVAILLYQNARTTQLTKLTNQFDNAVSLTKSAEDALAQGDKSTARSQLSNAKRSADELAKSGRRKDLDAKLAHRANTEADPDSVVTLQNQIQAEMDVIDGIVAANLSAVSDIGQVSPRPNLIALAGTKLLLANTGDNPGLADFDTATNKVFVINTPAGFGKAVSMTASSSGDGIYILTSQPSVWLYKATDDSLTQLSTGVGDWPKGKDIASYNVNLYILADDQIWRFTPTLAGFSGKSGYITDKTSLGLISGASTLAVDGSILVGGANANPLLRYTGGKVEEKSADDIPDSLKQPKSIQSLADGSLIFEVDKTSNRLGLIGFNGQALSYFRQYSIHGASSLSAATVNYKAKTVYVIADGKLWKFSLNL